jgi:hypothetical protein
VGVAATTRRPDRNWTYTVYRRFFERWAEYERRGAAGEAPAGAEVVYSTRRAGKIKTAGAGS